MNLYNALKVAHLLHKLFWDLFLNIVVDVMSPLPPSLLVQKLNLLLLLIQYSFSMVLTLEFTIPYMLDKPAQCEGMLTRKVIECAWI